MLAEIKHYIASGSLRRASQKNHNRFLPALVLKISWGSSKQHNQE
jgi:hypothetical protein